MRVILLGGLKHLTLVCADKDRELSESQAEIKALRLSERQRKKAVEEVSYHSVFVSCNAFTFFPFF